MKYVVMYTLTVQKSFQNDVFHVFISSVQLKTLHQGS